MAKRRQCEGITRDGTRCRGQALPDDTFCFSHSLKMAAERDARNRRGGRGKATAVRAGKRLAAIGRELDQEDVPAILRALMIEVAEGRMEPSLATAVAALAKTSVKLTSDLEFDFWRSTMNPLPRETEEQKT